MNSGNETDTVREAGKFRTADQDPTGAPVLLTRSEVPEEQTWDLSLIFPDLDAWEADLAKLEGMSAAVAAFRGRLGENAAVLADCVAEYEDFYRTAMHVGVYAHLYHDQDTAAEEGMRLYSRFGALMARLGSRLSFIQPELVAVGAERLRAFLAEEPRLATAARVLENVMRQAEYTLSEPEERLLARASEAIGAPATIFSQLNNADLKFGTVIDEDGNEIELTHGRYLQLITSSKREVRAGAFKATWEAYGALKNTLAASFAAQMKNDNMLAEIRGFESARARALFANEIPETVWENLVGAVRERLDLLHEYTAMSKRFLGLDDFYPYDLYPSLVKEVKLKYTFAEAIDLLSAALAPLGEEYITNLRRAADERWIDWAENRNKRSGAYSSGCYGTPPYILITWKGGLDDLYTLAHELGHSMHSYLTWEAQPLLCADYSIFLAEIASTTNEILLTEYLLATNEDPLVRLAVINHYLDGFKGTVFRQTQFAEFEHAMHKAEAEGTVLTADYLIKSYGDLNQEYYGPALTPCPEIGLEWSRIPHFYRAYYVYQYATGFSAATAFAKAILEEGAPAVERYLKFLRAGNSAPPVEVLRKAGVDMATPEPVRAALDVFEAYLKQFIELKEAQE
ncbi:MAG: oligoendopeptidase F [Clostridiaceae bacterium]|nr:oligoendopeptidase F [Clostridiaceae bacterium]